MFQVEFLNSFFSNSIFVCEVCAPVCTVCCSNLVGGKNGATPLAFLLNFNVTSHFNYLFSSPNLFHCVPQRSKAFQVVHHLAGSKPDFGLVRYTGGTKNGVKRLSNDYFAKTVSLRITVSHSVSFLHDLANDNPRIFVVRYTGGTKNGVKRLSNDYQRYLSNKKGARKERHINRL